MMSRKLPVSLLLLTCGLAALPACGGDDGGGSGDATATGTDPDTSAGTQGVTSSVTMDDSASLTDPDTTMDPSDTTDPTEDTVDPDTSTGEPGGVVAFRFTSLYVRDPHFFVGLGGCDDITDNDTNILGMDVQAVNSQFNEAIAMDDPAMPDGNLDLSLLLVFQELNQQDGGAGSLDFANGSCLIPADATVCGLLDGTALQPSDYTSMAAGTCQEPMPADLSPQNYDPQPGSTMGPCFAAGPSNVTIETSFASLPLEQATVAAQYMGDPANGLVQGTLRGFMSTATADATMLPDQFQVLVQTISDLLPGGDGCCAGHSDKDGDGWWFYADFTAEVVPWNG